MTRSPLIWLMALVVGLAGCSPAPPDDASAPVLVRGTVLDVEGQAIAGASFTLSISDWLGEREPGEEIPVLFRREYTADPDGAFEIRLRPADVQREVGDDQASFMVFELAAMSPGHDGVWAFSRTASGDQWAGDVPQVTMRSLPP